MNTRLLNALRGENTGRPPVWLMRQAGRYLPEYQVLRKKHSLWQLFHEPELACQVTHQPLEILGVDAAILFSDILVIAEAFGLKLHFPEGRGPLIEPCVTSQSDLEIGDVAETLSYVTKTITLLKPTLKVPLIGFCGGPFTVASYMIGDMEKTKAWIARDPDSFHALLAKITQASIAYLQMQERAGVDAIQIFDSWAGTLPHAQFLDFSCKYLKEIIAALTVPTIVFCRGSSLLAKDLIQLGSAGISFDWQRPLQEIRKDVPAHISVQGNLDPEILKMSPDIVERETRALLDSMRGDPGFIANLGHGVLPGTPVENVKLFVSTITTWQAEASNKGLPSDCPPTQTQTACLDRRAD